MADKTSAKSPKAAKSSASGRTPKKRAARSGTPAAATKRKNAAPAKRVATSKPKRAATRPTRVLGSTNSDGASAASKEITAKIAELGDWRGEVLRRVRQLIREADRGITEEIKWRKPSNPAGVPVWFHAGMICTGEVYRDAVKLTFFKGASLRDPAAMFNASLDGSARRAIDIHEGDAINEPAFQDLIRAAVRLNEAEKPAAASPAEAARKRARSGKSLDEPEASKPRLLSGGNPQIAKGCGDASVQAYIAAMPGWKCDVGRRLDALIARTVPGVHKAVKWNSPLYGIENHGWFLGVHCFTKYIKVAFFRGASLNPAPPGKSKQVEVRYLDIRENDPFDETQLADWIRQASRLPGERM